MIQGTDEWIKARLGKLTASRFADSIAKTKTGWGASRLNLRAQLVLERLTGLPADTYTNDAMRWGIETEPQARAAYEFINDVTVEQVGFIDHPTIPMAGASPDGLVGDDGMVEIKCPGSAQHMETLLSQAIAERYLFQMQFQMACTGRQWCDFVSFDPRLPQRMQLWQKRVPRDDAKIKDMESLAVSFLTEVEATLVALERAAA